MNKTNIVYILCIVNESIIYILARNKKKIVIKIPKYFYQGIISDFKYNDYFLVKCYKSLYYVRFGSRKSLRQRYYKRYFSIFADKVLVVYFK